MHIDERPELQREVQRLLGRCLLRLQQYEYLLKRLLAHTELAGPLHDLEARRAARIEQFAGNTLGALVRTMFETYLVSDGDEAPPFEDRPLTADAIHFSTRATLEMSSEQLAQAKSAVKDLVTLRNDLVHHFIEQFDIGSVEGCEAATKHLVDSYARIDGSCRELHLWATSLGDALRSHAEFMKTDIFLDFIANGIAPDGTVDWPSAGIVRALRKAGQTLAVDGWTPLDQAVAWITERHPRQTPARYNCRSWPQVLHESRVFQLEYRPDERGGRIGWYRDRDSGSR